MKNFIFAMALTILFGAGMTVSSKAAAAKSTAVQYSVTIPILMGSTYRGAFAFGPNPLYIHAGTWVTWVNSDTMPHTATSVSGFWTTGVLQPGQSYQGYFSVLGDYPYYCAVHGAAAMSGRLIVIP